MGGSENGTRLDNPFGSFPFKVTHTDTACVIRTVPLVLHASKDWAVIPTSRNSSEKNERATLELVLESSGKEIRESF